MRVAATGETSVTLSGGGEGLELESDGAAVSPYHLLAAALATCVYLVIDPWAARNALDPSRLVMDVAWSHADDGRVASLKLNLRWPGLPQQSREVVRRLASACPIHRSLDEGTEVAVAVAGQEEDEIQGGER